MKHIATKLTGILAVILLITGCKKSELTRFEQSDMIYIYKEAFNDERDSTTFSFAIRSDDLQVDTVKVPVRIMGIAKSTDREVKLAAIPSGTTAVEGVHYEFLPYTIPAGAYNADLPVVIKRTADLKSQEYSLLLEVVESKDFKPGVPNSPVAGSFAGASVKYLIKMNDFLTKPANWDSRLIYYFGNYSQVKYKFIIKVTGISVFEVGAPPAFSFGEMQYYEAFCKLKLAEYEAQNGPLIDEFGMPVSF